MKLLIENWRRYLDEKIDYIAPERQDKFDIGDAFPKITKDNIIQKPFQNIHHKNTLLDYFVKLQDTKDDATIANILGALRSFSGNSDEFTYKNKKSALEDYLTPYRHGDKSLRDYHKIIKDRVHDLTRHTPRRYEENKK